MRSEEEEATLIIPARSMCVSLTYARSETTALVFASGMDQKNTVFKKWTQHFIGLKNG